ncbi:hypothetical protein OKW22_000506 [Bacilli bacterium PM5-3]|nr:hypothetical protein [Bacilli bacterium PM5-3]MDH6604155.1 hypothetical protein [Bacilli bacterium PM5-9]
MEKKVNLIPSASNMIESTRSIGYTFETALADIIDNSIFANSKKIEIFFDNGNNCNSIYLEILDNGIGMNKEEIINAMKYGSSNVYSQRDEYDLGRFGLGLKTASLSQCRKLTVVSKKNGEISGCCWDLDLIKESDDWTLIILDDIEINRIVNIDNLIKKESGTIVRWENFDKLGDDKESKGYVLDSVMDYAEKHISLVYHRFFEEKKVEIYFNNRILEAIDPFFLSNNATQILEKESLKFNGQTINISPYIVPHNNKLKQKEKSILNKYKDLNLNEGLYIYRANRLIAWGKWFRVSRQDELSNLVRIRIDIPNSMDLEWKIDVKKSSLEIPYKLKSSLKEVVDRVAKKSKKVYNHKGIVRNTNQYTPIYNRIEKDKKIFYRINRELALLNVIFENVDFNTKKLINNLLEQLEDSIPYDSIYYDMATKSEINRTNLIDESVYKEIVETIKCCSNIEQKKFLLESFKNIEKYKNNKEIILKVEEEINEYKL